MRLSLHWRCHGVTGSHLKQGQGQESQGRGKGRVWHRYEGWGRGCIKEGLTEVLERAFLTKSSGMRSGQLWSVQGKMTNTHQWLAKALLPAPYLAFAKPIRPDSKTPQKPNIHWCLFALIPPLRNSSKSTEEKGPLNISQSPQSTCPKPSHIIFESHRALALSASYLLFSELSAMWLVS